MKKILGFVTAIAFASVAAQSASAQGFVPGYTDIGPIVGLGGIGDAGLAFGGRFEKGLQPMPSLGSGTLGVQVGVDYFSWSDRFGGSSDYSFNNLSIGVTANYHFRLTDTRLDPFVGLGLGYENWSCDGPGGIFDYCGTYSSAIYFIGRAGMRYFMSEKLALYGDVGAGAATLNLGVMFRLR
jgi:hypothetical protein